MQSCSSAVSVMILLLIIFITGSESAVPVVKVEYGGTAVLPCTESCSGVASWTPSHKSSDILAHCGQTSCRSVKEGYQMNYNQYQHGDLSLIISKVDFSKRGRYTCDCDGIDKCDVELQIEPLKTSVQIQSGDSLLMKLDVSDPVEVMYYSTGAAAGYGVQICTVINGSQSWVFEYKHRTSPSSSVLELSGMQKSDSGIYIIRAIRNKEDLHIYTVIVTSLKTSVQLTKDNSLMIDLVVSFPVEVIYYSTGTAAGSSGQICTVDGPSLQCKPEYEHRTYLLSSVLVLRDMKESDSGVYTVRIIRNKKDLHIYIVTVTDSDLSIPKWAIGIIAFLLFVVVAVLVGVAVLFCKRKKIKKEVQKYLGVNQDPESSNEERKSVTQESNKTIQDNQEQKQPSNKKKEKIMQNIELEEQDYENNFWP